MRTMNRVGLAALLLLILFLLIRTVPARSSVETTDEVTLTLIGQVVNTGGEPIPEAEIRVLLGNQECPILCEGQLVGAVYTGDDGLFVADVPLSTAQLTEIATGKVQLTVVATKASYRQMRAVIVSNDLHWESNQAFARLRDIILPRVPNPAFFLATAIFIAVFGLISLNLLHETIAAFLGAAAMLGISYFIGSFKADFWIISLHRAIAFIDFDVIFLLMTMMIFMAIMSQTGIFQWLAFQTFCLARGNAFLATAILVSITGLTSSVLNDTTVMLLMTPVSIQIALALNIHPAAIVVPEVLASNIGGAATLIGTPPNTIIGSYVGLSFNQFLVNMLPISLMSMVILLGMTRWLYRREFGREGKPPSPALIAKLEAGARITDPILLRKSLLLFGVTLILFFVEDLFRMPPAVVAILGSTALLLWVRPNVSEMLREVDWTTLVFFMSLFMMVGGVREVGLIQLIAESVKGMAGDSLLLATLLIVWVAAVSSAIVANIPFTAAMVPVTVFLTQTLPGAENNVLYWGLALGAGLGGNATYIGSAPNIVAVGIMDRAGFRLKFGDFSRVGVPVTFVTILVPTLWLLIRYFWLKF
ncbi:MAG: ArsB/NhaD family transporter [Anaerolineae bacterium]|nr:ArsB/NhaD family transporter [Anaerolineae bacterium]